MANKKLSREDLVISPKHPKWLDTIVADAEVEANLLRLKIVGNCQKLAFYYSIDGENYKELISNVNILNIPYLVLIDNIYTMDNFHFHHKNNFQN